MACVHCGAHASQSARVQMLDRLEWADSPEGTARAIMARLLRVDDAERLASALAGELEEPQELAGEEVQSILSARGLTTPMPAILITFASSTPDDDRGPAELYDSARAWWVPDPESAAQYRCSMDSTTVSHEPSGRSTRGAGGPGTRPRWGRTAARGLSRASRLGRTRSRRSFGRAGRRIPRERPGGRALVWLRKSHRVQAELGGPKP
jgi:hypothetical protein